MTMLYRANDPIDQQTTSKNTPTHRHARLVSTLTVLISTGFAGHSGAAGFAINTHSALAMGNGFAGAATQGADASSVYYNPAAMTQLTQTEVLLVGTLARTDRQFTNTGSTQAPSGTPLSGSDSNTRTNSQIPALFIVIPQSNELTFGLGINAPYGSSTEYEPDWVGRYHSLRASIRTININPALAFKFSDALSIGGGLSAQYADAQLAHGIDFGSLCYGFQAASTCAGLGLFPEQSDGVGEVDVDGWSSGWNLGLLYKLTPSARIGLAYRSQHRFELKGKTRFEIPAEAQLLNASGLFSTANSHINATVPATLSLGIHHQQGALSLMAGAIWSEWSTLKELRVEFDNGQPDQVTSFDWQNTLRLALGADYRLNDNWTLRVGASSESSPVKDGARGAAVVPGQESNAVSSGFSYRVDESLQIDASFAHVMKQQSSADSLANPALPHRLLGEYSRNVNLISAQIRWLL